MGSEGDYSIEQRGPDAIKNDLDEITAMFDPTAAHADGTQGGIDYENLTFNFSDSEMSQKIGGELDGSVLTVQQIIDTLYQMSKDRYTKAESDTALESTTDPLIKMLNYDSATGILTATTQGGETVQVCDLNVEKIPASIEIVEDTTEHKVYIRITNTDGTYTQSDVSDLLTQYTFGSTNTIKCVISKYENDPVNKHVTFQLQNNAVKLIHLDSEVMAEITDAKESSAISATSAATSASNAAISEANALASEKNAKASETTVVNAKDTAVSASEQAVSASQNAIQSAESAKINAETVAKDKAIADTSAATATTKATAAEISASEAKEAESSAKTQAANAATSANNALKSEQNAAESESKAHDYYTESETNATRAETASTRAEAAESRAEQMAATLGYVQCSINESGHIILERTDNVDLDLELKNGRLIQIWQ